MALQIWFPSLINFLNQGLSDASITTSTTVAFNANGKIGPCASFNGSNAYLDISHTCIKNTTDDWSYACWMKLNATTVGQCLFSCRTGANASGITIFYYGTQWLVDDGTRWQFTPTTTIAANKWYHICVVRKKGDKKYLYVNGVLDSSTTTLGTQTAVNTTKCSVGSSQSTASTISGNYLNGYLNDIRFYDHALSQKEVKMLSLGLTLHYPLDGNGAGQENLLRMSPMGSDAQANFVANSSTDWTKYFRYYNGSAANHTFSNGVDTVLLSSASNLGVCFQRKATDINLDSNSYYTLSCEAKCTKASAHLDIGLSYYNNSNAWVWRGGSNPKNFNAVNVWQKFTHTFKPDADTQYIDYCFTVVGVASGTDTFSIRHCKLEKGTVATPWLPNSADGEYILMGYGGISVAEYDTSGYGYDGTATGLSLSADTPKYDVSTVFDANTDTVTVYPRTCYSNGQTVSEMTVSCWFKTNTMNSTAPNIWSLGENYFARIRLASTTALWYYINVGTTKCSSTYSVGKTLTDDAWHHVVFTFKEGVASMYLDGVQIGTTDHSATATYLTCSSTGWHLAGYAANSENFIGSLSDFRIYATAFTLADVLELYHTGASIDKAGNMYAYELREV